MTITKLTTNLAIVSTLSDLPNATDGLTAAQLKAKFDEASGIIKTYLNNTLTVEVDQSLAAIANAGSAGSIVINGGFDVWQRGTSFAQTGPTSRYLADRWRYARDGTGGTTTVSRQAFTIGQTDVPNNPKYYVRCATTVAATGQTFHSLSQPIESVSTLSGGKATLSFWAKSNVARTISVDVVQGFGTGGSTSWQSVLPVNLTTGWQKFSVTFDLPSIAGKTIGANDYVWFEFNLPLNTVSTVDIAQVQVDSGDYALPFNSLTFAEELERCQRYYEKSYDYDIPPGTASSLSGIQLFAVPSNTISSTQRYGVTTYKVKKRISPTVTIYPFSTPSNTGRVSSNAGTDLGANSGRVTGLSGESSLVVDNGTGGSLTTTDQAIVFHYTADAEL
jgi:hypothetical protein